MHYYRSVEDSFYFLLSSYKKSPDILKKILSIPFYFVKREKALGAAYKFFYQEAKYFEFATKEEIEIYQFNKIKSILEEVSLNVPYYRNLFRNYDVNIRQIQSLSDYKRMVPFLTRDAIQQDPRSFVSQRYSSKQALNINTGGSTGVPLHLYYLKGFSRQAEWAHMHIQWERIGYKTGSRMAALRGDFIGKSRIYSYDNYRKTLMLSSFALNKHNANQYLNLLEKYKIEYINAYPASLITLIQSCSKKSNPIKSLKGIFLGSENIYDWQLKIIKDFFQIDTIFYWYGHGEITALAGNCEKNSIYHFFPTYGFTEFIPSFDRSGSVEIVSTSFINPLMPLLRYKTKDFGILNHLNCSCGRNHLLLKQIIGREQEIAEGYDGERITLTALIFGRHLDYFNHIIKMQIINISPGHLIVKVIPNKSFSAHHVEMIKTSLSIESGMPFTTDVEVVDDIMQTTRGKHKFFEKLF